MQKEQGIQFFALAISKRRDFSGIDLMGYFGAKVVDADDVTGLQQAAGMR